MLTNLTKALSIVMQDTVQPTLTHLSQMTTSYSEQPKANQEFLIDPSWRFGQKYVTGSIYPANASRNSPENKMHIMQHNIIISNEHFSEPLSEGKNIQYDL